jgi:hypothetical protein
VEKSIAAVIVVVMILISSLVVSLYKNSNWLVCDGTEFGDDYIMN